MRRDVYVQNDSGAWSLLSSSVVERVIDDQRDDDGQFVRAQEVVLASLVGDDSFVARVVVGEPLSADEQEQWIARFRTALKVPCGKLLVAGGFDPDVLGDWVEEGEMGGVQAVDVPPGHYLVDVYTFLHSMNGRVIVDDVWGEKLGAWFRRDHPGRTFPSWVASELSRSHEDDPGHEKDWKNLKASVDGGVVTVDLSVLDWVTFLVHLQPFGAAAPLDEPEEGDWFGAGQGLRRPAKFPLGIPAVDAEDPEVRDELEALLPKKKSIEVPPAPLQPVDILGKVQEHALATIPGGPVPVPLGALRRALRVAWFAAHGVHPEVRIETRQPVPVLQLFREVPNTVARFEGDDVRVSWPEAGGIQSSLKAFDAVPAAVWEALPEGSRVEVATCVPDPYDDPQLGLMRFKGEARRGVWSIQEAYPPAPAEALRDALELAASVDDARVLRYRDAGEAADVLAAYEKEWGEVLTAGDPPRLQGAEIRFNENDPSVGLFFAAQAFRKRHGEVWPVTQPEEDDEDDDS